MAAFCSMMPKKNLVLLLLFLGLVLSKGAAQINLVPNASFEELTSCPDNDGQIFFADPWFSATPAGTPDLFNSCSIDNGLGVPYNGYGGQSYQPSRTGSGYAGIFVYSHFSNTETREYIEAPLNKSLKINKQYYIRFFVSPPNSLIINSGSCYSDGIGAAFTKDKFVSPIGGLHVLNNLQTELDNKGKILSDTVNWIALSGCFTNTESEKSHMIIGNFRDNAHTQASPECDLSFPNVSYLYIEDVGVWEFDPLPDTVLLCKGEIKMFNSSFLEASYKWSDGTTDSTFSISSEGVYSVSANMGDCTLSDTVVLIEMEEQPSLESDTLICQGDKMTLFAPVPGVYEWSTGSKSSNIEITDAGIYKLTVSNECGIFNYESYVETEICDCPIYIPNAFSPNGDGLNDELLVFSACDFPLLIKHFRIFDRWGNLVYNSEGDNTQSIQWDGSSQGKPVSAGAYTWVMEYSITPKGRSEQKISQGDITILR